MLTDSFSDLKAVQAVHFGAVDYKSMGEGFFELEYKTIQYKACFG